MMIHRSGLCLKIHTAHFSLYAQCIFSADMLALFRHEEQTLLSQKLSIYRHQMRYH